MRKEEMNLREHWDKLYAGRETEELGWYEDYPAETLCLVEKCNLRPDSRILVAGAGTSTLIDYLLKKQFSNVIASDLSGESLRKLRERLGHAGQTVQWITDDLCMPRFLDNIEQVELWIDRAVLHFITDPTDQENYFRLLKDKVCPGGYILFGEFSLDGATSCAGLPVCRYSADMLSSKLGKQFEVIDQFNHLYYSPSGAPRPYVYVLFRRHQGLSS